MTSGLLMNHNLTWVAFNARFDFGYLINLIRQESLPYKEDKFLELCSIFFPHFYDVKQLREDQGSLATHLRQENLPQPDCAHQAGSDSYSTLQLYYKSMSEKNAHLHEGFKNTIHKMGSDSTTTSSRCRALSTGASSDQVQQLLLEIRNQYDHNNHSHGHGYDSQGYYSNGSHSSSQRSYNNSNMSFNSGNSSQRSYVHP